MSWQVIHGDSREKLHDVTGNSIAACVTDPPYDLTSVVQRFGKSDSAPAQYGKDGAFQRASRGFMGKTWDGTGIAFDPAFWVEVYRVLKPGAHLLAFGGTRTYHRMTCAIEDAGFEVRDCLQWIYATGFPKSHNLDGEWNGWGTALKPANEPIVLARKPLSEATVAANVLRWGTGALHIDGCRVDGAYKWRASDSKAFNATSFQGGSFGDGPNPVGRWPANVVFDEHMARELDRQSGERKAGGYVSGLQSSATGDHGFYGHYDRVENSPYTDTGGASRFFFIAKPSRSERERGLQHRQTPIDSAHQRGMTERRNTHPTIKPVALMRHLIALVTPPNGTVLDPFCGSGTTGIAALELGFKFIGIEAEEEYVAIARDRITDAVLPLFEVTV